MPPHQPHEYKKSRLDRERELNGNFRVNHIPEPVLESTLDSPDLRSMTSFKSRPLEWLWHEKIALGKLTLLEGPPGIGKLYAALDIAARVSACKAWPDEPAPGEVSASPSAARPAEATNTVDKDKERGRHADKEKTQDNATAAASPCLPLSLSPGLAPTAIPDSQSQPLSPGLAATCLASTCEPLSADNGSPNAGSIAEADPATFPKRYVLPADYVPPPIGLTPSCCVKPGTPRIATPVVVICDPFEAEDTIRPRLERLGADFDKLELFTDAWTGDDGYGPRHPRPIDFPLDVMMLEYAIRENRGCRLIVIDNLERYCPTPKQLRETIHRLDRQAIFYNVAIVATIQGNIRFTPDGTIRDTARKTDGPARCIWSVTPDPSHPDLVRLEPKRVTFCKKPRGIAFRIDDAGQVVWEPLPGYQKPLTEAARRRQAEHERLLSWLRDKLQNQVVPVKEIYEDGEEEGFTKARLRAARHEIGAHKHKLGFGLLTAWAWTFKEESEITPDEISAVLTGDCDIPPNEPEASAPRMHQTAQNGEAQDGEAGGSGMEDGEGRNGSEQNSKNFDHLSKNRLKTDGSADPNSRNLRRKKRRLLNEVAEVLARRILDKTPGNPPPAGPATNGHAGNGHSLGGTR